MRITNIIQQSNPNFTELQIKKINYGLECFLGELSKTILYLIFFALFNLSWYFILATVFFCTLRSFAGGFHQDTYWSCFFVSLGIFTCIVFTGEYFSQPIYLKLLFIFVSVIIICIYAPVDHHNKPIINPLRRKRFKYYSILTIIILGVIIFLLPKQVSDTAVLAILFEALTLPIGYYLQGRVY